MNRPLTAAFCRTVTRPGRYGDGGRGSHGLYLRVWHRTNGRVGKAWAQRIRVHGKPTNLGLGTYPAVTLVEARRRALANRQAVEEGRDPRGGGVPTFAEAAEKVIALHSKSWKPGSRLPTKWRQTFRDYAFPVIGDKRVGQVTTHDVMAILTPIWTAKPAAARAVRQRIGAVCKWAVAKGYREDNPAGDAITAALPRHNGGRKHHKALPHAELGDALANVRADRVSAPAVRLALEFVALTACRNSEVLGAKWSEIDGDTWTIPAARMKTRREHRVPLSTRAREVLAEARKLSRGSLVFPSTRGKQIAGRTLGELFRRLGIPSTVHGLRSAFRDWAAETGVARDVAEAALAHRVRNQVEAAYRRTDLFEARRIVAEDWGAYLNG